MAEYIEREALTIENLKKILKVYDSYESIEYRNIDDEWGTCGG